MRSLLMGLLVSFGLLSGCGGSSGGGNTSVPDGTDAVYRVTFQASWDAQRFPTNFPGNAHFSGLIGGTHNGQVVLWKTGSLASAGIKSMAETGAKGLLTNEVNAAIAAGTGQYLVSGGAVSTGTGSVSQEFGLNTTHSQISLVSMVAPSPDWFVGVSGLDLYDSGSASWLDSKVVPLKVYDAGTDSGAAFASGNAATNPAQAIALLTSNASDTDFNDGVQRASQAVIGTFTFTRIK